MSAYTVPALNAVDFALTVHTVPSLASPRQALSAYTVPALNAVDFTLVAYTTPTYMDVGWELLPSGGISYTLVCNAGAYTYLGQSAELTVAKNLSLSAGAYTYAGSDATLDYVPGVSAVNYVLDCASGNYIYTGSQVDFSYVEGRAHTGNSGRFKKRKLHNKLLSDSQKIRQLIEDRANNALSINVNSIDAKASAIINSIAKQSKSQHIQKNAQIALLQQKVEIQNQEDLEMTLIIAELI